MDIETLKKNPRTQYLATEYEKLERQEAEVVEMIEIDPSMKELAMEDIASIALQKSALEAQIKAIEEGEKEEEEFPNEIVLEVRAGAGGGDVIGTRGGEEMAG